MRFEVNMQDESVNFVQKRVIDHTRTRKILLREEFTRTLFFNFQRALETIEIKTNIYIFSYLSILRTNEKVTFQRMSHRRRFHGAIYFTGWKQIGQMQRQTNAHITLTFALAVVFDGEFLNAR